MRTFLAGDAATALFNLPDYRAISRTMAVDGCLEDIVEIEQPPGCPSYGVIPMRRKESRLERVRDVPVAGSIEVVLRQYCWYCQELVCERSLPLNTAPKSLPGHAPQVGTWTSSLTR